MPFYEIVFETGRMSVANFADDEEAASALKEHVRRATAGEAGGPIGQPAERVAVVYKYNQHPDAYNEVQTATADVLEKEIGALLKSLKDDNGVVSIDQLAMDVRGLSHPMKPEHTGFDSFYKMKETGKLKPELYAVEG